MDLEELKRRYVEAQKQIGSPELYMGQTQSFLEQLLKINYSRSTGFEWTPQNGGLVELINALWSYDQESLERMHNARKIRNKFAHEGRVSPNEAQEFDRLLADYINFIESGQLQTFDQPAKHIREENVIVKYGIIKTAVLVIIANLISVFIGSKLTQSLPYIGPILAFIIMLSVFLFSFLYVVRRYALISLLLLIGLIFVGGLPFILVLAVGIGVVFYVSDHFIDKWLGWYIYSYLVNSWYFVLGQFPFSLFTEAYFSKQEQKAREERAAFERQQKEYAQNSQRAYEDWEKTHHADSGSTQTNHSYDPYQVLGVTSDTPMSEVKKSYRKLAKAYHPDLNKDPGADVKFKEIQEAWESIMKK